MCLYFIFSHILHVWGRPEDYDADFSHVLFNNVFKLTVGVALRPGNVVIFFPTS